MKVLVLGGSGTVGSEVVAKLVSARCQVRTVARNWTNKPQGAECISADITTVAFSSLLEDIDAVFVSLPVGPDEVPTALRLAIALARSKVHHVVHLSAINSEQHSGIPHFAAKRQVEEILTLSNCNLTILRANHFFQNDFKFLQAIENGLYPLLYGQIGVHAVDARDVAQAAVNAMTDLAQYCGIWPLTGLDLLTTSHAAAQWSAAFGRSVEPITGLEAWDIFWMPTSKRVPEWLTSDMRRMWEWTMELGCRATVQERISARKIVGQPLRRYPDFVSVAAAARFVSA